MEGFSVDFPFRKILLAGEFWEMSSRKVSLKVVRPVERLLKEPGGSKSAVGAEEVEGSRSYRCVLVILSLPMGVRGHGEMVSFPCM